jgi:hypothetical protein
MNTKRGLPLFLGAILILGGLFLLLGNLGLIELGGLLWAIVLAGAGVFFVLLYFQDRRQWWAWIPGITLLSVGVLIALEDLLPGNTGDLGGVIVPGGIGLSFLLIYVTTRQHWWAIIPGGALLSIAAMIFVQEILPSSMEEAGIGVFFLGLGLTFLALSRVGTEKGQMKWPVIPGGILLGIGILLILFGSAAEFFPYIGALALIAVGGFILWRATHRNQQ